MILPDYMDRYCKSTCCCAEEFIGFSSFKIFYIDFSDIININNAQGFGLIDVHPTWETPQIGLNDNIITQTLNFDYINMQNNVINQYQGTIYNPLYSIRTADIIQKNNLEVYAIKPGYYYSVLNDCNGGTQKYLETIYTDSDICNYCTIKDKLQYEIVRRNDFDYIVELRIAVTPRLIIGNIIKLNITVGVLDCDCQSTPFTKCINLKVTKC